MEEKYIMGCINCGKDSELYMLAHRNKEGLVCGWIFVCHECFGLVAGNDIQVKVMEASDDRER